MASVTFSVDDDLKSEISKFVWINLSEIARQSLIERFERAKRFERFDEILRNSKMTDELALKLADELKNKVAKKHGL